MSFSLVVGLWIFSIVAVLLAHSSRYIQNIIPNSSFLGNVFTYGKQRSGRGIFGDVPKRWFTHFYILAVAVDATALYYFIQCAVFGGKSEIVSKFQDFLSAITSVNFGKKDCEGVSNAGLNTVQMEVMFALGLLFVQSLRRLYECFAVTVYSREAKIHIGHYILGIIFYMLRAPLILQHLGEADEIHSSLSTIDGFLSFFKWNRIIGLALFLYGFYHQTVCHRLLADLRSSKTAAPNRDSAPSCYHVPHGDWFEYVSSPHYLAEIIIYLGLSVAIWPCVEVWLIPLFSLSCLSLSAYWSHLWYLEEFPEYKKLNRKALIPFVW